MMYRWLVRPLLYLMAPETAHHVAFGILRAAAMVPGIKPLMRAVCLRTNERLHVDVLGRTFPNPVGLAAGFDKDAIGFEALGAMGFGHIEVGTLTGQGQPGNPRPRLFRLQKDRALINRMGFNNHGSAAAVERLRKQRSTLVGVNVGKTKLVSEADATADYVSSVERLGAFADYLVVNVSSPNTPGLRDLQSVDKLRPLLSGVRDALDQAATGARVPLLVKIAPDLADEDIDAVADLAIELGLDGIIATNTTINRSGLSTDAVQVDAVGAGGLSGAPLKERSLDVLTRIRRRVGDQLVLIAVGGIETADDAWARILAGASLVQVYTAFIYEGPFLPSRLAAGLDALAAAAGYDRVQDAIGASAAVE